MKTFSALPALVLTLILSVSVHSTYADAPNAGGLPQQFAEMKTLQEMPALSGKVVETMDGGGYTYVHIEKDGKKTWVAVPVMKVSVGQAVSFVPGVVMNDFTSKALGRTFDSIVFSSGAIGGEGKGSAHSSSGDKPTENSPADKAKVIKIDKASGPDAYTVAEIYEKSTALDKKSVSIKGQVVKVSAQIMGKNWIHIQDGSGNASNRTNDLLVTSQDLPSVGDVVTAKGTLYKDKDFGSGYKYSVVIEGASVK